MKLFILLSFIILGNSCSQAEDSVVSEDIQKENVDNSNDEVIVDQQQLGPNEIMLKIKIIGPRSQNKEICGLSKEHVFHVEVTEILRFGSSITQKISKQQQMDVAFLFGPEGLKTNMILEVKAREGLCPDTSTSYFTIIEHKILE